MITSITIAYADGTSTILSVPAPVSQETIQANVEAVLAEPVDVSPETPVEPAPETPVS